MASRFPPDSRWHVLAPPQEMSGGSRSLPCTLSCPSSMLGPAGVLPAMRPRSMRHFSGCQFTAGSPSLTWQGNDLKPLDIIVAWTDRATNACKLSGSKLPHLFLLVFIWGRAGNVSEAMSKAFDLSAHPCPSLGRAGSELHENREAGSCIPVRAPSNPIFAAFYKRCHSRRQ